MLELEIQMVWLIVGYYNIFMCVIKNDKLRAFHSIVSFNCVYFKSFEGLFCTACEIPYRFWIQLAKCDSVNFGFANAANAKLNSTRI